MSETPIPNTFQPIIMLDQVEGPVNLGSVCRAMANTGFGRLRYSGNLETGDQEVRKFAVHAASILDASQRYPDLATMMRDVEVVFGFSPRDPWRDGRGLDMDGFLKVLAEEINGGKVIGLLFGNEARGLDNAALAACHYRVALPADPGYVSLNLAQAVMVVVWEMHRNKTHAVHLQRTDPTRGTPEEKEVFLCRLRTYLEDIEYLNPQNPELIWREVSALFRRRDWTQRDLALLTSMIHKGHSRFLSLRRRLQREQTRLG